MIRIADTNEVLPADPKLVPGAPLTRSIVSHPKFGLGASVMPGRSRFRSPTMGNVEEIVAKILGTSPRGSAIAFDP
jgi:hypothetical protein